MDLKYMLLLSLWKASRFWVLSRKGRDAVPAVGASPHVPVLVSLWGRIQRHSLPHHLIPAGNRGVLIFVSSVTPTLILPPHPPRLPAFLLPCPRSRLSGELAWRVGSGAARVEEAGGLSPPGSLPSRFWTAGPSQLDLGTRVPFCLDQCPGLELQVCLPAPPTHRSPSLRPC